MKRLWKSATIGMMSLGILGVAIASNPITRSSIGTQFTSQPVLAQSIDPVAEIFPILANVNFTPEQEEQFANIRAQTRAQINTIVSSEQQQKFWQSLAQGEGFRAAIASAQLTPDQRQQIGQILRAQRQQISSLVTPAQKQQIRQNIRQQWSKR